MNSKLIDICFTADQADYSEQYFIAAKYLNVTKLQIVDCTLSEVSGTKAPYTFNPVKYYDSRSGQLWIVTADAPN
jgi:hypothetical protein